MTYRAQTVNSFAEVTEQLRAVERASYAPLELLQLAPRASAPPKPRKGMIAYADGVAWNPGAGEGVYVFKTAWVLLG